MSEEVKEEVTEEVKQQPVGDQQINIITRLRAERRELQEQLAAVKKEHEMVLTKLEDYDLKDQKSNILKATLNGRTIQNPEKLEKWVNKLSNRETLEADIQEIVEDFTVKPESVKSEPVEQPAPVQAPVIPSPAEVQPTLNDILNRISVGIGTPVNAEPISFNANDPFELLKLQSTNPEAYQAWKNKTKQ